MTMMLPTFTNQIGLISEWLPILRQSYMDRKLIRSDLGILDRTKWGHHAIELRELVIWLYGYMAMDQYY